MAKNATTAPVIPYTVETGIELPPVSRLNAGRGASPFLAPVQALKLSTDPKKLQSFFIPAEIAANITDETEKAKAYKESARKIANRISGLTRRLTKANPTETYAIRSMTNAAGIPGVRVFRVKAEPKATA